MENLTNQPTPTFESVWALLQTNAQQMKESRADFDRRIKENDMQMQKSREDFDRRIKENDMQMQKSREDFDQSLQKSREDFDRSLQKSREDSERRMKKIEETMGSWSNNHGSFAEEYFFNSFENGQQDFFGEKFDEIEKNIKVVKRGFQDEYDIVMFNGSHVAIIEVKYKAHKNDLPKVLKKAETFRILCPDYKESDIFLGLASLSFYPELEQECIKQGIAVIKQVGETVVINDAHLKVF